MDPFYSFIAQPTTWLQTRLQKHSRLQKSNTLQQNLGSYRFEGECWNVNRAMSHLYQYTPFGHVSMCVIHFRISLDFLLLIYLLMHLLQCFFCFFCIPLCSYMRN